MEIGNDAVQSKVHFDRIGQIAITVSNLARSRDFYQNTLGMKLLFDAGKMLFYACGEVRFMISATSEPVSAGGTILYFKVDDIQGTHAELEGKGVAFVQGPHMVAKMANYDLWMAFLKDPDGYVLGVMSEIPQA